MDSKDQQHILVPDEPRFSEISQFSRSDHVICCFQGKKKIDSRPKNGLLRNFTNRQAWP